MISKFINAVNDLKEVYQNGHTVRQFKSTFPKYFIDLRIKAEKEEAGYIFTFSESYPQLQEDAGVDDPTRSLPLIEQYNRDLQRGIGMYRDLALAAVDPATRKREEVTKPTLNIPAYNTLLNAIAIQVQAENRNVIEQRTKDGYLLGVKFSQRGLHPYGIKVAFKLPYDKSVIGALQTRNTRAFAGLTDDMGKEIIRQVSDGAIKGETIKQISTRIENAVDRIGPARAETIARTELMKSVNTAVRSRFESAGASKLRRMETKDERTCKTWEFNVGGKIYFGCAAIDGQIFTLEEAAQIDEQTHPGCRGTWVVIFAGLNPVLQPGSMTAGILA